MNLLTSLVVVVATLAVIGGLIARPGRWLWQDRLSKSERRRLAEALRWWPQLDRRRRDRLLGRVAAVRREIAIIGGNGWSPSADQRLLIAGLLALASLGPDASARRLPGECVVYGEPPADIEAQPQTDLLEDFGELASGTAWQTERLAVAWPQCAAALAGEPTNPLLRDLMRWRIEQARADAETFSEWQKTLDAAITDDRAIADNGLSLPTARGPAVFAGALAEAFFQQGRTLQRAAPALYDLMAAYFDFDTAPQRPAGHRTPALRER